MPRGIAIAIGVRAAPIFGKYNLGVLEHAESDACKMAGIAKDLGYEVNCFLGPDATCAAVGTAIDAAAADLTGTGDTLLLSFSGHGVKTDSKLCEADGNDEHWCLYDGLVVDDRIRSYWGKLKSQARAYTVADCCYSGEMGEWSQLVDLFHRRLSKSFWSSMVSRMLVPAHIRRLHADIRRERRKVRKEDPTLNCDPPKAPVLMLCSVKSGPAKDGAFMRGLRGAWVRPEARVTFRQFRDYIEMEVQKEFKQPPDIIPRDGLLADARPFEL